MAATRQMITREFAASHMRQPSNASGYGMWMFRNHSTGEVVSVSGRYTECVKQLADGFWVVLP